MFWNAKKETVDEVVEVEIKCNRYQIPPEALEEILGLWDILNDDESLLDEWKFWSAISRVIPQVAAKPNAAWIFRKESQFVFAVYEIDTSEPTDAK